MATRRDVLKAGAFAGAAATVGGPVLLTSSRARANTIDPTTIPKYVTPLTIIPAMPPTRVCADHDEYVVGAGQIFQQMLPDGFPKTRAYGFGTVGRPYTYHTPGYTIEARADRKTQVTWVNQHMDASGRYTPSLLTIDPTLHWANPPGGFDGRDSMPTFTSTPPPYTGPVPMLIHLHGGHTYEESDGYPEAWTLPAARDIPRGYATVGSFYDRYKEEAAERWGVRWQPGSTTNVYPLDQRATMLWYHDHSLGITRTTVHAGLAGMFAVRGGPSDLPPGVLPGPAPRPGDAPNTKYYEIGLVFSDRTFNVDGSLSFPESRAAAGDTTGPYIPHTDVPPYWNPGVLSSTVLVNGRTWPYLNVEPRRYRFRTLTASNFREFELKVMSDPLGDQSAPAALPLWVIGSDGGFMPKPVPVDSLPTVTAERYDIIIDFTNVPEGSTLYLCNVGFGNDPNTTGQILRFNVGPLTSKDNTVPPDQLQLPPFTPVGPSTVTRQISFTEQDSSFFPGVPVRMSGGTMNADGTPNPLDWDAPITETPEYGTTETWEILNYTLCCHHAFHVHLVQFQVVERVEFPGGSPEPNGGQVFPWEVGWKDTFVALPFYINRVRVKFDRRGRYIWHCHLLDHEDNGMMRPLQVT